MTEWIPTVGYAGLSVLVVTWLLVSFMPPSSRRAILEWLGACGMYVALLMLFAHLLSRALANDSTLGAVAFGFLVAFFSVGLVLCIWQTLSEMRGGGRGEVSATN